MLKAIQAVNLLFNVVKVSILTLQYAVDSVLELNGHRGILEVLALPYCFI